MVNSSDVLEGPAPVNNILWVWDDCLIWRKELSAGGCASGQRHRQAYMETGRVARLGENGGNILHLCHRPFCLQPGHLYEGTLRTTPTPASPRARLSSLSGGVGFEGKRTPKAVWETLRTGGRNIGECP